MKLKPNDRIVFFGDSITEWGRDKTDFLSLGHGYVNHVSAYLAMTYPELDLTFFNRGIGGNKIHDLNERINDCLDLQTDVVILMIGINDTWHNAGSDISGTKEEAARFENEYRILLDKLTESLVKRLFLIEPFVLHYPVDRANWRDDLDKKIQIVRKMADTYDLEFLPIDGLLNEAARKKSPQYYTGDDGVHPTNAGAAFIAKEVIKRIH